LPRWAEKKTKIYLKMREIFLVYDLLEEKVRFSQKNDLLFVCAQMKKPLCGIRKLRFITFLEDEMPNRKWNKLRQKITFSYLCSNLHQFMNESWDLLRQRANTWKCYHKTVQELWFVGIENVHGVVVAWQGSTTWSR